MPALKQMVDRDITVIDNKILKDEKLSWRAKGIICYLRYLEQNDKRDKTDKKIIEKLKSEVK